MKKLICTLLAGALALSMAACGGAAETTGSSAPGAAGATAPEAVQEAVPEETAQTEEAQTEETQTEEAQTISGSVATNGSTSMEKVVGVLSEQFMYDVPSVTVTYDATGSGTGIEAVRNGSCDIGLASRGLKEEETGLIATTVALDGIAVIVNPGCGVTDLSVEQIAAIFTGEITNWKELGGEDLEIACIGREAGSGTRDGFESVTDTSDACRLAQELTSTGAVIEAVAASKNAIGYASLSAVENREDVLAVTVDGTACTEEAVLDGSYAIQRPFNMVTREGAELSPAAKAFLDFATSEAAADLIRAAGAVPAA